MEELCDEKSEQIQSNSIDIISDDEDVGNHEEHNIPLIDGTKPGISQNSLPSLSIGKIKIFKPRRRNRFIIRRYLTLFLTFFGLLFIIIYILNAKNHSSGTSKHFKDQSTCDHLITLSVWNKTFPMLTIESALRLIDVNNDTIQDIIVPFGTGIDAAFYNIIDCQIYFNISETDNNGCGGGIMALDGRSGEPIWYRYTPHELFAINCKVDINNDGIKDCIVGGRMASLYAFDGATGEVIWTIPKLDNSISETSNFYTPLYVPRDLDNDNIPDIVVMHGGDPLRKPNTRARISGRLMVISAAKGNVLTWSMVPDKAESYYSPQLLTRPDGTLLILFGTGGETHPGSLFVISFDDLLQGKMKNAKVIYSDCCKGVMVPPVIVDINGDNILDIIMALFNSTVIAYDGLTFQMLWRKEFIGSETYSTPAVGFFNNDSIPDFAVIYQHGPGFPIYYYTEFTILDGRDGNELLDKPVKMLIGTQSSPLTISTSAANDVFLYWYSSCENNQINGTNQDNDLKAEKFRIALGTNVHDTSRADFCKLRFNSPLFTQFRALTSFETSIIYDSRNQNESIQNMNYTAIEQQWINDHLNSNDDYYNNNAGNDNDQQFPQSPYQEYQSKQQQSDNSYPLYERIASSYSYDKPSYGKRYRRHVGLHNGDGIQRVISTGTLAPPLSKKSNTIDLVFATYWFPPSKNVRLLPPEIENCISQYMAPAEETRLRLEDPNSIFKQLQYDHDMYETAVIEICSRDSGLNPLPSDQPLSEKDSPKNIKKIKEMGSMTVYRVNVRCMSSNLSGNTKIVELREYNDQLWSSYMGKEGDCIANVNYINN